MLLAVALGVGIGVMVGWAAAIAPPNARIATANDVTTRNSTVNHVARKINAGNFSF